MKKASFLCMAGLFLNACSSVPTPSQYDLLLQSEARAEHMAQLIDNAKSGNTELQYYLGTLFENARFTGKDQLKAIEWYRLAAQNGSEKGQNSLIRLLRERSNYTDLTLYAELGDYYQQGLYVPQDNGKALEIYLHAATRSGNDVKQKLIKLLNHLSEEQCDDIPTDSCEQLRTEAQYQLAMLYRNGKYLKKDATKSQQLMQRAAIAGHDGAIIKRASDGINGDDSDWAQIRTQLESIHTHSAWSAATLASLYYSGKGGDVEKVKALHFYEISADLGDEKAANFAFYLHQQEAIPGAKAEKAGRYLWLAAQKDFENTRARLAQSYLFGSYGIPSDYTAAAQWGKQSSEMTAAWLCKEAYYPNVPQSCIDRTIAKVVRQGHPYALYLMGQIYTEGANSNIERAISLYKSAISQGEYAAKVALAELYLDGKAGPNRQEQGLTLLREMQNDSEPGAAHLLARHAFEQKDYSLALRLSLQAEKEQWVGNDTYYHLYRLYSGELGTPKHSDKATHYFALALSELNPNALYDKANTILDEVHDPIIYPTNHDLTMEDTATSRKTAAADMLIQSANQAYIPAMLRLAVYYTDQNQPRQAEVWTLEAASHGDINSQKAIGALFENKQTLTAAAYARYWYGQAESQGDKEAIEWMTQFGTGNIAVDNDGKYCDDSAYGYCYSRATSKNPVKYFKQEGFTDIEHKLQLYADGSVTFSDSLQPHEKLLPDLKANVEQVWPTHCGFALQKATGSGLLLFPRTQQFCQPPHDVVMAAFQHGIKEVTSSSSASSLLLNNGQVVSWGGSFNGGGLITPAIYLQDGYTRYEEEIKVKRAVASDVSKIVAGTMSMAALKTNGDVYIWGDQSYFFGNQLVGKYKDIMANGYFDGYCSRDTQDNISCWGERYYKKQQRFPANITQFALVERAFMALSLDTQGKMSAWSMHDLNTQNYAPKALPASLANGTWTNISKEQVTDGYVTVLTRSDGERFAVRFSTNQFSVRPFKPKEVKMMHQL